MIDLAGRVTQKIQLSTDGHAMYPDAVRAAFSWKEVDFAQVVKHFRQPAKEEQCRYSPASCTGVHTVRVIGRPDEDKISTSMVERTNLMLRTGDAAFHPPHERLQPEGNDMCIASVYIIPYALGSYESSTRYPAGIAIRCESSI
jgi:hypothetical protein